MSNTRSPTIKRIHREARELQTSPSPDFHAHPLESNLFEWHFTLRGPPSTPYAQGIYHGRIVLPATYPLRPPSFRFLTPSGRFEPNREICLSISGHHEETWQPAWGIRTALTALRAFMEGDAKGQLGGVDASAEVRERLARESRNWRCGACAGKSCDEMLAEVAAAATATAPQAKEEEIPRELRMAYREDVEGRKKDTRDAETASATNTSSSPPSQTIPANTEAPQAPRPASPAVAALQQRRRPERPATWLDTAIGLLSVVLAFLIIRWFIRRIN